MIDDSSANFCTVQFCAETELSVDEKYKKTLEEIEALKDHLGMITYMYQAIYCCILLLCTLQPIFLNFFSENKKNVLLAGVFK